MKGLVVALAVAVSAATAFAKEAVLTNERVTARAGCMTEWTPFALTLCGPVGLPWGDWNVKGLQIGVFNSVNEFSGLQIGVVNVITTDDVLCLPVVNWSF